MAHLSERIRLGLDRDIIVIISLLLLITFAIKSALFPFFFWLPDSYPTPPIAVSALFAGFDCSSRCNIIAVDRYPSVFGRAISADPVGKLSCSESVQRN